MINIKKNTEPRLFQEWKAKNPASTDFDDISPEAKKAIRDELRKEQGYICCYCMSRIYLDEDLAGVVTPDLIKMKVEHFKSQKKHPRFRFDYKNIIGACCGNKGAKLEHQHCDARKGSDSLKYNPAADNVESFIKYKANGVIYSSDKDFNKQLGSFRKKGDPYEACGVLNLNRSVLVSNRREKIDAVLSVFPNKGAWTKKAILDTLKKYKLPDSDGKLKPFCGIVIDYLNRKLRKATS